jgi:hypothetical protein
MPNTIRITNRTPSDAAVGRASFPPNAPLDFGSLSVLFTNVRALSVEPTDPDDGDMYLDDGTNTKSGQPGWRMYISGEWSDLGLQEAGDIAIDGGVL